VMRSKTLVNRNSAANPVRTGFVSVMNFELN
jgi:hypothetical protein